jgi:hypothetical protein
MASNHVNPIDHHSLVLLRKGIGPWSSYEGGSANKAPGSLRHFGRGQGTRTRLKQKLKGSYHFILREPTSEGIQVQYSATSFCTCGAWILMSHVVRQIAFQPSTSERQETSGGRAVDSNTTSCSRPLRPGLRGPIIGTYHQKSHELTPPWLVGGPLPSNSRCSFVSSNGGVNSFSMVNHIGLHKQKLGNIYSGMVREYHF